MAESVDLEWATDERPDPLVERDEAVFSVVFLATLLLIVVPQGHPFQPVAFAAAVVLTPVMSYVQRRLLDDVFDETVLILVVIAAIAVGAALGYLTAVVWYLIGVNVGELVLAVGERVWSAMTT